jgi:hypothetical protein
MPWGHADVHGDESDAFYFDDGFEKCSAEILLTVGIAWQKQTTRKRKFVVALVLRDLLESERSASANSLFVPSMARRPSQHPENA